MSYTHSNSKKNYSCEPVLRSFEFLRILSASESVSKADIMQHLNLRDTAFYKHLAFLRQHFTIRYVGSIGGNAYYSLDKTQLAAYFNLS